MYYGNIKNCDIADGIGVRVSLFVSGCRRHCEGCMQPETWAFDYGKKYTTETEAEILRLLEPEYIDGLTLLGGEPFEPENVPVLVDLLRKVNGEYPCKNVWCYTGYTLESLLDREDDLTSEMLSMIDVLVDGPFIEEKKNALLAYRGSENQRIINMVETIRKRRVVLRDFGG